MFIFSFYVKDNEKLNAGYGSMLTEEGTVECESAIMEDRFDNTNDLPSFGAVGCVNGI